MGIANQASLGLGVNLSDRGEHKKKFGFYLFLPRFFIFGRERRLLTVLKFSYDYVQIIFYLEIIADMQRAAAPATHLSPDIGP